MQVVKYLYKQCTIRLFMNYSWNGLFIENETKYNGAWDEIYANMIPDMNLTKQWLCVTYGPWEPTRTSTNRTPCIKTFSKIHPTHAKNRIMRSPIILILERSLKNFQLLPHSRNLTIQIWNLIGPSPNPIPTDATIRIHIHGSSHLADAEMPKTAQQLLTLLTLAETC